MATGGEDPQEDVEMEEVEEEETGEAKKDRKRFEIKKVRVRGEKEEGWDGMKKGLFCWCCKQCCC